MLSATYTFYLNNTVAFNRFSPYKGKTEKLKNPPKKYKSSFSEKIKKSSFYYKGNRMYFFWPLKIGLAVAITII